MRGPSCGPPLGRESSAASRLPQPASRAQITDKLSELSGDPAVHGIICQAPLPDGVALAAVGSGISVGKDIDGASPVSLGMLAAGVPGAFPPATAAAVMAIPAPSRAVGWPAGRRSADPAWSASLPRCCCWRRTPP